MKPPLQSKGRKEEGKCPYELPTPPQPRPPQEGGKSGCTFARSSCLGSGGAAFGRSKRKLPSGREEAALDFFFGGRSGRQGGAGEVTSRKQEEEKGGEEGGGDAGSRV